MPQPSTYRATVASADRYLLAEGPGWDAARGLVRWVDIDAARIHQGELRGDQVVPTRSVRLDGTTGAAAWAADGSLLVANHQVLTVVAPDGTTSPGPRVIPEGTRSRLNDGACDAAGRFLVGSMALDGRAGTEVLCRYDADRGRTVLDDDLTLSNGLGWSPDDRVLYSIDSSPGVVHARDYDVADGRVGPRRDLFGVDDGTPDGLAVDVDGHLWIAVWGAGEVRRYAVTGELLAVVQVDAPHTSSVAFVGPELDRLLITTAHSALAPDLLAAHPDSGRLFTVADVGTRGRPANPWSGWAA